MPLFLKMEWEGAAGRLIREPEDLPFAERDFPARGTVGSSLCNENGIADRLVGVGPLFFDVQPLALFFLEH
jgi:hypothetical protein